jgi:hypothetical protein
VGSLAPRPTPNLEDQVSIFISPGYWVAQLYPRHRVPILIAFYDMHGLQWDYYFPRSPHGDLDLILFLLSLAPQPSLGLGLLHKIRLNFLEAYHQFSFLQGRVVSPTPNLHSRRPGLYLYPPEAGWLPISVTSYDTHGLLITLTIFGEEYRLSFFSCLGRAKESVKARGSLKRFVRR